MTSIDWHTQETRRFDEEIMLPSYPKDKSNPRSHNDAIMEEELDDLFYESFDERKDEEIVFDEGNNIVNDSEKTSFNTQLQKDSQVLQELQKIKQFTNEPLFRRAETGKDNGHPCIIEVPDSPVNSQYTNLSSHSTGDSNNDSSARNIEDEISMALLSFSEFNKVEDLGQAPSFNQQNSASSSSDASPFGSPNSLTNLSESSNEENSEDKVASIAKGEKQDLKSGNNSHDSPANSINMSTIYSIKQSMVNTSRLNSLFTTLKITYLKLCKEFNYLLHKFNENERIKMELIHENNELKKLLTETIRDREIDRIEFKKDLSALKYELTKKCLQSRGMPSSEAAISVDRPVRKKRKSDS